MKEIIAVLVISVFSASTFMARPNAKTAEFFKLDSPAAVLQPEMVSAAPVSVEPVIQAPVSAEVVVTPPPEVKSASPKATCAANQWVRADNGQCLDKPKYTAPAIASSGYARSNGSGSCEAEISKYNWNYSVAVAVARAESGLNPGIVNNNPGTGDYSVGCFQINIYGANARTRPSEAELKNAATNVAWAYKIYTGNGSSFIGQWGVCRSKVSCY